MLQKQNTSFSGLAVSYYAMWFFIFSIPIGPLQPQNLDNKLLLRTYQPRCNQPSHNRHNLSTAPNTRLRLQRLNVTIAEQDENFADQPVAAYAIFFTSDGVVASTRKFTHYRPTQYAISSHSR